MESSFNPEPDILPLLRELGTAHDADEYERVLELVPAILEKDPKMTAAHLARAAAEYGLKNEPGFLAAIDGGLSAGSDRAELLSLKALGLVGFGEFSAGAEAAESALELHGDDANTWMALALARICLGDAGKGLEAAKMATTLKPDDPVYLQTLWQVADEAKEYETALEAAEARLAQDENDVPALIGKASALVRLKRPDDALHPAERAYELEPKSAQVLRVVSVVSAAVDDDARMERALREWLEVDPDASRAWSGLGLVYSSAEEWERAVSALRRSLDLAPENHEVQKWLGNALVELDDGIEALATFVRLCELAPEDPDVWLGRSSAERAIGLADDAVSSAQKGLEHSDFESAEGWLALARSYSAAGRHQNAWRAFGKAGELERESSDAALGAAVESITCCSENRALNELRDAEARHGPSALIEFNRGVAYYKLGREGSARDAWSRARELDPELGAVDELVSSLTIDSKRGSWADHWFGDGAAPWRRIGGGVLLALLLLFLAFPYLEPGLLPGISTGDISLEAFVPALFVALLILFPTIRGLAVGSVTLDVAPIGAPHQAISIDSNQVLPVFTPDEIDVGRLINH